MTKVSVTQCIIDKAYILTTVNPYVSEYLYSSVAIS